MRENSSGPQAMVVQSIVMSRTEEKTLFVLLQCCTSNMSQLTLVESLTKFKSISGFASLYCGSLNAFSLDYRRKYVGGGLRYHVL